MTQKTVKDMAASVRQQLLNRSKKTGEDFQAVLTQYALERILYRLGCSRYCDKFVLKGALLFPLWGGSSYRPTMDADLLGSVEYNLEHLKVFIREVCALDVEEDGIVFDAASVNAKGKTLQDAMRKTFERRQTAIPANPPLALSSEFYNDAAKQKQWTAFVGKNRLDTSGVKLEAVIQELANFLMPPASASANGELFDMFWPSGGQWKNG